MPHRMDSTSKNTRLALTIFLSIFEIGGLVILGVPTFLFFVIAAFGIPVLIFTNAIILIWGCGEILRMLFGFRSDSSRLFASIRRTICAPSQPYHCWWLFTIPEQTAIILLLGSGV